MSTLWLAFTEAFRKKNQAHLWNVESLVLRRLFPLQYFFVV